jgi:hypothetical protein
MEKIYLYTFCVYIGKHSIDDLLKVLNLLINSLTKTNTYELHIFTNFELNITNSNIVIHNYFDKNAPIYSDNWYNLSFNKITIYKHLYDKYKIDFTWIDLDTIVMTDINYINKLESYFIDCDGSNEDPQLLIGSITIPRNKWIQGNIWKLNINLYDKLINIYNEFLIKNMTFNFDLQSLFTYYFYFVLDGRNETLLINSIYIIGKNIKKEVLNGLAIWDPQGNTHPNLNGLNNLYYENNTFKSRFYPDKEIHIISFTFDTLKQLYNTNKFKELFLL